MLPEVASRRLFLHHFIYNIESCLVFLVPYSVVSEYNTAVHGKAMMKNTSHKVQRKIVYKIKAINPANLFGRDENRKVFCSYCRKIGGHRFLYEDHQLKNEDGKILCPILKEDGCFLCDATGDKVHLPKECPKNSVNTNLKN